MYTYERPAPGESICVGLTPRERCSAIQYLIRPDEVAHLVAFAPHSLLPGDHVFLDDVARYMRQTLRYFPDPQGCDRWSSPARTLYWGGGDCDDLAIFGVSMLLAGCVDAFLAVGRVFDGHTWGGHAWVEGRDPYGPFLFEATSGNVFRGRYPQKYRRELEPRPGLCRLAA